MPTLPIMSNPNPHLLLFILLLLFPNPIFTQNSNSSSSCPLDFSLLPQFLPSASSSAYPTDTTGRCAFAVNCLHLLLAYQLNATSLFLLPPSSTSSCISSLESALSSVLPSSFSLSSNCNIKASDLSSGCMNISSISNFTSIVPPSAIASMNQACNQQLLPTPACTACTTSLVSVTSSYLNGANVVSDNVTNCASYPFIYAGGVVNQYGAADHGTAYCLFLLPSNSTAQSFGNRGHGVKSISWVFIILGCVVGFLVIAGVLISWFVIWRRRKLRNGQKAAVTASVRGSKASAAMESISASTTLKKFSYEEIKAATGNFSRDNIIGKGGYGNVYKGVLPDGTEIAVKRFKNCAASGDDAFAHEVEVVASVRHINLVALHGFCIATTPREGHQRIIVCDLMHNGSLHDHLFGAGECQLSWPVRQKIAVGMARGLAYLHTAAQPAIIHRDIKASNILIDDGFEAKVADFGLAKFALDGVTHVSTRVAGTMGYVAPEYALYGQLTEKSDVYSFGVVLLELLSGKKAFVPLGEGQNFVLAEWAWSLVRRGKTLDVIQEGVAEPGPTEVMENYVLIAVLCTHPQLHARPSMDQVVKIMEADVAAVLSIPDRPIPIISNLEEIERSASSSGSGQLFSPSGFRPFIYGSDIVTPDSPKESSD